MSHPPAPNSFRASAKFITKYFLLPQTLRPGGTLHFGTTRSKDRNLDQVPDRGRFGCPVKSTRISKLAHGPHTHHTYIARFSPPLLLPFSTPPPSPLPSLSAQGAFSSRRCRLLHSVVHCFSFSPSPLALATPPFSAVIKQPSSPMEGDGESSSQEFSPFLTKSLSPNAMAT